MVSCGASGQMALVWKGLFLEFLRKQVLIAFLAVPKKASTSYLTKGEVP
jgi:hypothetical protein